MPIGPGSFIAVTPGSGAKLATGPTYTENANVVQDEKVVLGEQYVASYLVTTAPTSTATANSHLLQIMAGASLKVRIRRIEMHQYGLATAATIMDTRLIRLTSAGTGGTGLGVPQADPADAAAGATAMTLPTVKGTEGSILFINRPYMMQTIAASAQLNQPILVWDFDRLHSKPLIIAAGAANGVVVKNVDSVPAAQVTILVWLDEAAF